MTTDAYDQFMTLSAMLGSLDKILTKAEADAESRKIDPQVFLHGRLAPDMLPFVKQIQIISDQAMVGSSRLAVQVSPIWADYEQTFAVLLRTNTCSPVTTA